MSLVVPPFENKNRDKLLENKINGYNKKPNNLVIEYWDRYGTFFENNYILPLAKYQTMQWYEEFFETLKQHNFISKYKQKHGFLPEDKHKNCRGHSGGSRRKSKLQTKFLKKLSRKSKKIKKNQRKSKFF